MFFMHFSCILIFGAFSFLSFSFFVIFRLFHDLNVHVFFFSWWVRGVLEAPVLWVHCRFVSHPNVFPRFSFFLYFPVSRELTEVLHYHTRPRFRVTFAVFGASLVVHVSCAQCFKTFFSRNMKILFKGKKLAGKVLLGLPRKPTLWEV